jgi:exodeoxyribonuclease VII small subunit
MRSALYDRVRERVNRGRLSLPCRAATFNVARVTAKSKLPDFERSLSELEALVAKLEQGDVPLEDALKTFERGVALTRQCQTALRTAQQKVEVLLARNGNEELARFAQGDDEGDEDEVDDEDADER